METPPKCKFALIFSIIISLSLALLSFILCIASEIKRNKKEDLRWNGKQCYLPSSQAFGLGIAALVSFFLAQIIGNCILFKNSCSRGKRNAQYKLPVIARLLLLISWCQVACHYWPHTGWQEESFLGGKSVSHGAAGLCLKFLILLLSFGIAVILLVTATSMNRRQPYGVGWLNGECYLVKGGTYAGSAILILVTVGSVIGSALSTIKTNQAEQGRKIHAQIGG